VSIATPHRARRSRAETVAENRSALLAAAAELVVEVGYSAAQLDEIAGRAGLTKGAVYSIFGGKTELLRELVAEHAGDVRPMLGLDVQARPTQDAEAIVSALARAYVTFCRKPEARRVLALEVELSGLALRDQPMLDILLRHERAQAAELARTLARHARRDGSRLSAAQAELAAELVMGALGGLAQRMVVTTPSLATGSRLAATLVALLDVAAAEAPDA